MPGVFFVTFQNNTNENLTYRWAVETWRAEAQRPFGLTAPETSTLTPGTSNFTASGWAPRGQGECIFYRAKVVALDEGGNRSDFVRPDGSLLWHDFTVCP
jgi:hypothetical protein